MHCFDETCGQKFLFYFEGTNEEFVRCAWPSNNHKCLLIFRGVVALYEIVLLLAGPYLFIIFFELPSRDAWKYFIYWDTWQSILATTYFTLAFATQLHDNKIRRQSQVDPGTLSTISTNVPIDNERHLRNSWQSKKSYDSTNQSSGKGEKTTNSSRSFYRSFQGASFGPLKWYNKIKWALLNVCINIGVNLIGISAFLSIDIGKRPGAVFYFPHYHRIVITFVLLLIEMFLVSYPIYVQHLWFAEAFALSYLTFSTVYLLNGGTDHYGKNRLSVLYDFQQLEPTIALSIILIFAALPTGQCFAVLIVYLRRKLITRIYEIDDEDEDEKGPNQEDCDDEGEDNTSLYDREFERRMTMIMTKTDKPFIKGGRWSPEKSSSPRSSKASKRLSSKTPSLKKVFQNFKGKKSNDTPVTETRRSSTDDPFIVSDQVEYDTLQELPVGEVCRTAF